MIVTCPLMLIEWVDSRQTSGAWVKLAAFEPHEIVRCASVGWVVQDDGETLVLAQSMGDIEGDDVQAAGLKAIPCVAITARKPIEDVQPIGQAAE